MSDRRERLRWRVAYRLDSLPNQCWPSLVTWALDGDTLRDHVALPWDCRNVEGCRADAARTGSCYCSKFQDPAGDALWAEHVARVDAVNPQDGDT